MTAMRETAIAAITARLAAQLTGVAVERARFGDVDTDNEPLPRLLVTAGDLAADESAEPLVVHYTLSFTVQGWCTVARGTAAQVDQATSELHARTVAALSGWTPAEAGIGEPAEEGAEMRVVPSDESAKPLGEFTARFSLLILGPLIAT
jgi:hypothetical protein